MAAGMTGTGGAWVGIAANANSGMGRGRLRVERLARALDGLGLGTRVAWTPEARAELVAEAGGDPQCRCLVAAGGDGTVAALVNERPAVPIAVLPAGTENLFARQFGIPRRPERVAGVIAAGRSVRIDLGLHAGRRFTLMAGLGFDADVVTRHHRARVGAAGVPRPTHRAAYVEPVLRSSFGYQFPRLTIQVADPGREEALVGTTAFLFNLPRYALGLPIAPSARADDGLLDLVVFRDPGPWRALHYLWTVLRGLHLRRDDVYHRRVGRVVVSSAEPVPVQLDGDPFGCIAAEPSRPWTVEVLPGAIDVLVPPSYPPAVG
jgi:diacylglycerol kinase (ATP)